jgi:tetratricopeptide (TPR) repeat protein
VSACAPTGAIARPLAGSFRRARAASLAVLLACAGVAPAAAAPSPAPPPRTAAPLDLAAIDAALEGWRLRDARQLLATANGSGGADVRYAQARLALTEYRHVQAVALAAECARSARTDAQRSRCAEVEAEAVGMEVALSDADFSSLGLASRLQSLLQRATRLDPRNVRAQVLQARYRRMAPWLLGGSASQAEAGIDRAARLAPALADEFRGIDAYDAKAYDRALPLLRRAERARPDRAAAAFYLALAHEQRGELDAARTQLRDVVARYPDFLDASYRLAVLELDVQPARAAQLLRRYIPLAGAAGSKRIARSWRHLGRAEALLGRREQAIDAYRRTLRLKPDDDIAQAALERLQ